MLGSFLLLPLVILGVRRPRRDSPHPVVEMYSEAVTEKPGGSKVRGPWRECYPGATPSPFPPGICPRPHAGVWNQEPPFPGPNSNQMAQVENHSSCLGEEGCGRWAMRACSLGDESGFPPTLRAFSGSWGSEPKPEGGCRSPRGGCEDKWLPREPPGKAPPCPAPTFSWPREPKGIPLSAFPVGANGAQIGGGVGIGKRTQK